MTSPSELCPICEENVPDLLVHVVLGHMTYMNKTMYCWCESVKNPAVTMFADEHKGVMEIDRDIISYHLKAKGGIIAHYLECQLGINR